MKKRCLVTGGAGFIGSNLVDSLLKRGEAVTVLDNLSTGFMRNVKPKLKHIHFIRGDIRNARIVRNALKDVGIVFHEAAVRSVAKSVEDPFVCHEVDATGTMILLQAAYEKRVNRFVYASTSAAYGNVLRLPQRESDALRPLSPYGSSKLAGELYCLNYFQNKRFPTVCLRYFNVYGPRQNPESKYSSVIPAFIDTLRRGKKPVIDGTGRQSRDFVYVGDIVSANLKAAFGGSQAMGRVFNIASGKAYSVLNTLKLVAKSLGVKPQYRFGPARPGDALKTRASITEAKRFLGWRPSISFADGVKNTVEWFNSL